MKVVKLKQSHITAGAGRKEHRCATCPLALALTERFKEPMGTNGHQVFKISKFPDGYLKYEMPIYTLSTRARMLVTLFDSGKPISPCTFQIFPVIPS